MQLDNIIINTRVRSGWAAIDLGVVLGRRFWLRAVVLYLVVAVPVFCFTRLVSDVHYMLPYVILWWFKPLFERPTLYFMSRELFGERVGFWRTIRNWREWGLPGLSWILTIRRISIGRGMYAPITLLEKPSHSEYPKRASVLGSKFASESTWLTVIMYHLESFLAVSLLMLLTLFFPDYIELNFTLFNQLHENNGFVDFGSLLMMAVVAPFYVGAGFMLYISRRVELEGWDIEMCFRDWMTSYKRDHDNSHTEAASR